jgi:hypothetical protein
MERERVTVSQDDIDALAGDVDHGAGPEGAVHHTIQRPSASKTQRSELSSANTEARSEIPGLQSGDAGRDDRANQGRAGTHNCTKAWSTFKQRHSHFSTNFEFLALCGCACA